MKKGLRLFGNPVHPMLSHFPMALLMSTAVWDLLLLLYGSSANAPGWWAVCYYSLVLGLILAIPTAVTGFIDFVRLKKGSQIQDMATLHLFLVLVALTFYLSSLLVRRHPNYADIHASSHIWGTMIALPGLACLIWGGHLGGRMVYRKGAGVDLDGKS